MEGRLAEVMKEAIVDVILYCVDVNLLLQTFFIVSRHLKEGKDIWCRNLDRIMESHRLLLLCPSQMAESRNPQRGISLHKTSLPKVVNIFVSVVVRLRYGKDPGLIIEENVQLVNL